MLCCSMDLALPLALPPDPHPNRRRKKEKLGEEDMRESAAKKQKEEDEAEYVNTLLHGRRHVSEVTLRARVRASVMVRVRVENDLSRG